MKLVLSLVLAAATAFTTTAVAPRIADACGGYQEVDPTQELVERAREALGKGQRIHVARVDGDQGTVEIRSKRRGREIAFLRWYRLDDAGRWFETGTSYAYVVRRR
jgi:hypothetical protein